jgi:hypothetical protein
VNESNETDNIYYATSMQVTVQLSNSPPDKPALLNPPNGSSHSTAFNLSWQCTDLDNDVLNYTVRSRIKGTSSWNDVVVNTNTSYTVSGWTSSDLKTYEWCVVASDGKASTTSDIREFTLTIATSIIDIDKNTRISIYPNPAKEFLIVDLGMLESKNLIIEIIDIKGTLIYKESIKSAPKDYKVQINLLDKKTGTYLVKIGIGNAIYFKKLIIE